MIKFEGSCSKTVSKPIAPIKIVNFYIIYEIKLWPFYKSGKFSVRNSLFETVKLTKNVDSDKYSYSGWGISFDIRKTFSLRNSGFGRNVEE